VLEHTGNRSIIEAPFALLEKEVEVLHRDTVTGPGTTFGLAPEILNAVDVVTSIGETSGMIDPHMAKFGYIQNIVTSERISIYDAVRYYFLSANRNNCF
jgi:hypothetical protein